MTVGELIEHLQTIDPNARVYIPGCCDSGLDDLETHAIKQTDVLLDGHAGYNHGGRHCEYDGEDAPFCSGVVLG